MMRRIPGLFLLLFATCPCAFAQSGCPNRPAPGSPVVNPLDLYSSKGVLSVALVMTSEINSDSYLEECYNYLDGTAYVEAPTLHLNPGDTLQLSLTDRLTYVPPPPPPGTAGVRHSTSMPDPASQKRLSAKDSSQAPCNTGAMVATSTNVHFHGLNIPPLCHQDDVINTTIPNTGPAFVYGFQVPSNDQPGLYWYHPHLHGFATLQVNGGAPGALIIDGIEKFKPEVGGLPERVLIIRQQFTNPNSWLAGANELTLNYQPAIYPNAPAPVITMQPGAKEFWRVANASSQAFVALQVRIGNAPEPVEIIALDGIPVKQTTETTTITIPPAGRAEFIVTGPALGQVATFDQIGVNTGPIGNVNPAQELALINTSSDAQEPPALPPAPAKLDQSLLDHQRFAGLAEAPVTTTRHLYFAEATTGSNGPTQFFMAVEGEVPKVFDANAPPAIVTKVGAVEEWIIENHSGEDHAFHIHQIHFLFEAQNGVPFANPELRDTVLVPYWDGKSPYPSVTLKMDFRDPTIAGTFVFHCHVLDHEDAGMMQKILVKPN